jgi:hypothetical protein
MPSFAPLGHCFGRTAPLWRPRWPCCVGAQYFMGVVSDLKGSFDGAIEWFLKVLHTAPRRGLSPTGPGITHAACHAPRPARCGGWPRAERPSSARRVWCGSRRSKRTWRAPSSSASCIAAAKAMTFAPLTRRPHARRHARAHPPRHATPRLEVQGIPRHLSRPACPLGPSQCGPMSLQACRSASGRTG